MKKSTNTEVKQVKQPPKPTIQQRANQSRPSTAIPKSVQISQDLEASIVDKAIKNKAKSVEPPPVSNSKDPNNLHARTRRLSGNYTAEVWKTILEDDNKSAILNFDDLAADDGKGYDEKTEESLSSTDFIVDDNLVREYLEKSRRASIAVGSVTSTGSLITAGPITLSRQDLETAPHISIKSAAEIQTYITSSDEIQPFQSNENIEGADDIQPPSKSRNCLPFLCCKTSTEPPSLFNQMKVNTSQAIQGIGKYCSNLATDFDAIEWELNLDSQLPKSFSQDLNSIGARIWFITFALAKHFLMQLKFDNDQLKFKSNFTSIVESTVIIAKYLETLEKTLETYRIEGLGGIGQLKQRLTGDPDTDLNDDKLGDEIFISEKSVAQLQVGHSNSAHLNIWGHKVVQYGQGRANMPTSASGSKTIFTDQRAKSRSGNGQVESYFDLNYSASEVPFELIFAPPDTLRERKDLEIYVKNLTRTGWIRFETSFKTDKRIAIEHEILTHTKRSVSAIAKFIPKVLDKLKSGCCETKQVTFCQKHFPCFHPTTCLPWITKLQTYISYIVDGKEFCSVDYEILRIQILTVEEQLKSIISRMTGIRQKICNVISIVQLCCDFLANIHHFDVLNYEKLRPKLFLKINVRRPSLRLDEREEQRRRTRSSVLSDAPSLAGAQSGEYKRKSTIGSSTSGSEGRLISGSKYSWRSLKNPKSSIISYQKAEVIQFDTIALGKETVDDADFYLHEYAMVLKVVPLSHGLREYILVNRVEAAQRHSGVNFDGPRYLHVFH